ncbi:hypothetical protein RJ639_005487 [Escallonia herrerae]|uniref:RNase H type-1 domain-containing protein n=1 Tax=Escallonia herrerae TaxID=1293975 RepID=A0AA88VZY0_9ASTE|nr:hypothetical protein RJ639_005487 [Escallonia herrerae]
MSRAFEKLTKTVEEKDFQIATLMNKLELQTNDDSNRGKVNKASKKAGANGRHDGSTSDGFNSIASLLSNRSTSFKELATRAHDMEISIANHGGNSHALPDPRKRIIELLESKHLEESRRVNEVRPIFISAYLDLEEEERYFELLKEFKDVFAWMYKEILGLDLKVTVHHLTVKSGVRPVKQAQRTFHPKVVLEIEVEINKLSEAGSSGKTAIKGHALVDFLADHPIPSNWEISEDCPDEEVLFIETFKPWMMFFDGTTWSDEALIIDLQMALELGTLSLAVSGDSKLVIYQLLKEYEVKKEDLVPYFRYATILINKFDSVELEHVPREENHMADALPNLATTLALRGEDKVDIPICQQWVLPELLDCRIE